jgi:hypothetical protein
MDKPRLTLLSPNETRELEAHTNDLAYPRIVWIDALGVSYSEAEPFRAWKASQSTSGAAHE